MNGIVRLLAIALCAAWSTLSAAQAACVAPPELTPEQIAANPEDYAVGATRADRLGRVVAPVSVNGQGPFRFIVDTGANRSVLSRQIADRLGLAPSSTGDVHSVLGVTSAPFVRVDALSYQSLRLTGEAMPMLEGAFLAGEQGILGVDSMRARRLRMDFVHDCIEIIPSRGAPRLRSGWITVRGQLRFGHLVVVPARIQNVDVTLFLDTGSNHTLANPALQTALAATSRRLETVEQQMIAYTAGQPVVLENAILLPHMRIGARGEITLRNATAYVNAFHIFDLWGLRDQPALLVGMDVLSQTRELAIDYERATVHFRFDALEDARLSVVRDVSTFTRPREER